MQRKQDGVLPIGEASLQVKATLHLDTIGGADGAALTIESRFGSIVIY